MNWLAPLEPIRYSKENKTETACWQMPAGRFQKLIIRQFKD